MDPLDFVALINRLVFQRIMEEQKEKKGDEADG